MNSNNQGLISCMVEIQDKLQRGLEAVLKIMIAPTILWVRAEVITPGLAIIQLSTLPKKWRIDCCVNTA